MSSRTPKLDLVLPVGGEHVSRAIINENNTKIDTGFGTLSEHIGTLSVNNFGSKTVSQMEGELVTLGNSLEVGEFAHFSVAISAASGEFAAVAYIGFVEKIANNRFAVTLSRNAAVETVVGRYNGAWTWQRLANINMFAKLTGTTSFQSIDPQGSSRSDYMGGTLDAKIHGEISSFTDKTTNPFCVSNNGPIYSGILSKTNNNYYCGIVYSYHDSGLYTVWYFAYSNGTYILRPFSPVL